MNKIWFILTVLSVPILAVGGGFIQDRDVSSLAQITGAGGTASQLINDTKIYVTANGLNEQLSSAITNGDIGSVKTVTATSPLASSGGANPAISIGSTIGVSLGGTGATTFASGAPLIGAGTGAISTGTKSGSTSIFATTNGTLTSGDCVSIDVSGNLVDAGAACGTGGGGGADTALDNLASTAVNVSILPGVTNSINLGSSIKMWSALFASSIADSANQVVVDVANKQLDKSGAPVLDWSGTSVAITGGVKLNGSSSGSTILSSGSTPTAHTVTLPSNVCSSGQAWTDNGSGVMSCASSITASLTGNASTATALASAPTQCSSNQFSTGVATSGNANCAQPAFTNLSGTIAVSQIRSVHGSGGSPVSVTAAGGITADSGYPDQVWFVQGSGGAVTITANPQISAGSAIGQTITVCAESNTNTVTFSNGTGLVMNGSKTLLSGDCDRWIYDGSSWNELPMN